MVQDGTILTNAHVVSDMAEGCSLTVLTADGQEYKAYIHSMDALSDLAVVKIHPDDNDSQYIWPKATLGLDPHSRPGDWVAAIGSPFGLTNTVTAGVISSQQRSSADIGSGKRDSRVEFIQTDCVMHSGSSGGPLVNMEGEVIGRAEKEGISFAIRVDKALDIIDQLQHKGRVVRPYMGMGMATLSEHVWKQLKETAPAESLPKAHSGVLITSVVPQSPAAKGGCLEGDVIVSLDGERVTSTQEILKLLGSRVGEPVKIDVRRAIPLDMDWDGRSHRYETRDVELFVTPVELDAALHGEDITRKEFH
ncbi:Serine protease htra2, mitochondrial [Borealophlyctis nickersoniae]|nr:Serine protease htra2, mitochondrial [Borealophlyctis nickersoniae]